MIKYSEKTLHSAYLIFLTHGLHRLNLHVCTSSCDMIIEDYVRMLSWQLVSIMA